MPHPCVQGTRAGTTHSTGPAGPDSRRARIPSQHSGKGPASPAVPASRTKAETESTTETAGYVQAASLKSPFLIHLSGLDF